MITVTIDIKEGSGSVGLCIVVKGSKTATSEELFELHEMLSALEQRPQELFDQKAEGFTHMIGKGKKASDTLRNRIRNL